MAGAYGLLSGLQRISFRGREPWCGSMDRCTKGVDLIFLADLSEPDAAAGRTDYDTDMGIWNERLLRLPEFLHERQGWGTDGICKFRMGVRELAPNEAKRWAPSLQMVYSALGQKNKAKEMDDLLDAANKAGN